APGRADVEILRATLCGAPLITCAEPDRAPPPAKLLEKEPAPDRLRQLALGVSVSEAKDTHELPMGHPSTDQTPRMVVIGNARWLANDADPKLRKPTSALLGSCISWLRERPNIGEPPEPKDQPTYALKLPDV